MNPFYWLFDSILSLFDQDPRSAEIAALSNDVASIRTELHSSRSKLNTLDRAARGSMSSEVVTMRQAVLAGQAQARRAAARLRGYQQELDGRPGASASGSSFSAHPAASSGTVDAAAQLGWVQRRLEEVAGQVDAAAGAEERALAAAMDHGCAVLDVGQAVGRCEPRLAGCRDTVADLVTATEGGAAESSDAVDEARASLEALKAEMYECTAQAAALLEAKQHLEAEMTKTQDGVYQAEYESEERRSSATTGLLVGAIGFFAAPFTGGASIPLAAAAGGSYMYAGYKMKRMKDFEREAESLRSTVEDLNAEIEENREETARVEQERKEAEERVSSCRWDLMFANSRHRRCMAQAEKARWLEDEIDQLKAHADSTRNMVSQTTPGLTRAKHDLVARGRDIKAMASEISSTAEAAERSAQRVTPGTGPESKRRQLRNFDRQKKLLAEAQTKLERIDAELPALLPGRDLPFLLASAWAEIHLDAADPCEPFPEVRYCAG